MSPDDRDRGPKGDRGELERLPTDFTRLETEPLPRLGDSPVGRDDPNAPEASTRTVPRAGQMVDHYRLDEKIGEGGMAVVFRAHDTRLGREVAIKFLPEELAGQPERLQRFLREARIVASLNHPNIVVVHTVEEAVASPYMVMELVPGHTLRSFLTEKGLPLRQVLAVAVPVAEALAAAHARGVTHRDIKPENVMMFPDGRVKVVDFGIAKPGASGDSKADLGPEDLTGDRVLGTIAYMSPEQLRGEAVGPSSDVFSFGVVLYELAAGKRPFRGKSQMDVAAAILNRNPLPIPIDLDLPDEFKQVLIECLAKKTDGRPPTMEGVARQLRSLQRKLERSAVEVIASDARLSPGADLSASRSVAVVPFQDLTEDRDQTAFCMGMSEEIATELSRIPGLRVTVLSRLDRDSIEPLEMGRFLGATAVLDGSVRKSEARIRITVRLVSVVSGDQLWSERFDRPIKDALEIQEEVAKEVAQIFDTQLGPRRRQRSSEDPNAYAAYLRGRFFWGRRYEDGLRQALRCYDEALELDPQMARAHAGRADCFVIFGHYGIMEPREAYRAASASVHTALDKAPDLVEPRVTAAWIDAFYNWDRARAEMGFSEAIRLDSNYPTAHEWYGIHQLSNGQPEEALDSLRRARALDPLSLMIGTILGWAHFETGRFDRAEKLLENVLEMEPRFSFAQNVLGIVVSGLDRLDEAVGILERNALASNRQDGLTLAFLGYLYGRAGRLNEVSQILRAIAEPGVGRYVSETHLALPLVGARRLDAALDHLERSVEKKESFFASIHHSRLFDEMRDEPRFKVLLRSLGVVSD